MGNGFCIHCGAALNAGDRFCTKCGVPVNDASHAAAVQKNPPYATPFVAARQAGAEMIQPGQAALQQRAATCPVCQKPLKKDARFCIFCGTPVADAATNAVAAAQSTLQANRNVAPSSFRFASPCLVDDDLGDESTTLLNEEQESSFDIDEETIVLVPPVPRAWLCRETTGERYEVKCPAVIGKGSAATCRIAGNGAISRKHAKVTLVDGVFYLEDLGSTNKTKVNHEEIIPGEECRVSSGDVIELADEVFVFEVEGGV